MGKLKYIALISFIVLSGGLAQAGPGDGSGGGGGAVCFNDSVNADACVQNGLLSSACSDKIKFVFPLEFIETRMDSDGSWALSSSDHASLTGNDVTPNGDDQNWSGFLHRVLSQNLKPLDPLFYSVLMSHIAEVNPDRWPDVQLPIIQDLGFNFQDDKNLTQQNCLRIQLARRDDQGGHSKFSYNKSLFSILGNMALNAATKSEEMRRLRIYNQALLVLHEAIYLMAVELDPSRHNSGMVRWFVPKLLWKSVYQSGRRQWRELLLQNGLNRYYMLLPHNGNSTGESQMRIEALISASGKTVQAYRAAGLNVDDPMSGADAQTGLLPKDDHFLPVRKIDLIESSNAQARAIGLNAIDVLKSNVLPNLTDREAFVLIAFDRAISGDSQNFESLFTGDDEVKAICHSDELYWQEYRGLYGQAGSNLVQAVHRYCEYATGVDGFRVQK